MEGPSRQPAVFLWLTPVAFDRNFLLWLRRQCLSNLAAIPIDRTLFTQCPRQCLYSYQAFVSFQKSDTKSCYFPIQSAN